MDYSQLTALDAAHLENAINLKLYDYAQEATAPLPAVLAHQGQGHTIAKVFCERGWATKLDGKWVVTDWGFYDWMVSLEERP